MLLAPLIYARSYSNNFGETLQNLSHHMTYQMKCIFHQIYSGFFSLQLANKQNSFSQETKIKINIQSHKVTSLHGYTTLFEGVFPIYHFEVPVVHL